jgi:DegV family protein with EDD domain
MPAQGRWVSALSGLGAKSRRGHRGRVPRGRPPAAHRFRFSYSLVYMSTHIITDSTCDLPPELIQRYGIEVIPIGLTMDRHAYQDGVDLSASDFYRQLPSLRYIPTTASPSLSVIEAAYQRARGQDIAAIFLAASFSSLYLTAQSAAREFAAAQGTAVAVIDSGQLSLGLGWQVLAAAEAAAAGQPLVGVLAAVAATRRRLKVYALLDALEYVRHGGRVSAFTAALGGLLRIKVDVELMAGEVKPVFKMRTRHQAIDKLAELARGLGPLERLAILHAHRLEEAQHLAEQLSSCAPQPPLLIEVCGAVATHVGPGALGVAAVTSA